MEKMDVSNVQMSSIGRASKSWERMIGGGGGEIVNLSYTGL